MKHSILSQRAIRRAKRQWIEAVQQALRVPPILSLPQWADKYRRLSTSSGAVGGPWRTSRVEVARGPMMAMRERGVKTITVECSTQTMKTEILQNIIGYHVHLDPCPMLLLQPKDDAIKKFSKERLAPMIRATPVLQDVFGDLRARRSEDTLGYKEFPGGFLALESAGSPTNLAMRAIRITLLDEIDKYETTKEGDPVNLAEERTATFDKGNSLHVRTCSPTWVETSRIHKSYLESDQRRAFVKCPHCRYDQTLEFFKHVHWNKQKDGGSTIHFEKTAAIVCEKCGWRWQEEERQRIMTTEGAIRWRQTRPFVCCGEKQEPLKERRWIWSAKYQVGYAVCKHCGEQAVPNRHAGYQTGKLYSPFITIVEIAEKWILSKDHPETKQTFYNMILGLPFESQAMKKADVNALAARREVYPAKVPKGVLVLAAGMDVQSGSEQTVGRVEVEVVGWGLGEESWSIEYRVFDGDPAKAEIWAEIDAYLLKPFEYEGGGNMFIQAACIDSGGHNTQEVYKFARARIGRKVWAIKGASDKSGQWSPVVPINKQDPKKTKVSGFRPIIVGVNAAKDSIRQFLQIETPGPGYCHFSVDYHETRFDQLTAERLVIERKGGFDQRKFVPLPGRANEALDCRVYSYAALNLLYDHGLNLNKVKALVDARETETATAPGYNGLPTAAIPAPETREAAPRKKVRPSAWMS